MPNYTAEQLHLMRIFGRGDLAGDLDWLLTIAAEHAPGERDLGDMHSRFTDAIDTATKVDYDRMDMYQANAKRGKYKRRADVKRLWPGLRKRHGPVAAKKHLEANLNVHYRTIDRDVKALKLA